MIIKRNRFSKVMFFSISFSSKFFQAYRSDFALAKSNVFSLILCLYSIQFHNDYFMNKAIPVFRVTFCLLCPISHTWPKSLFWSDAEWENPNFFFKLYGRIACLCVWWMHVGAHHMIQSGRQWLYNVRLPLMVWMITTLYIYFQFYSDKWHFVVHCIWEIHTAFFCLHIRTEKRQLRFI